MSALESNTIAICRQRLKLLKDLMSGELDHQMSKRAEIFQISIETATREMALAYHAVIDALDQLAYDPDSGLSREVRAALRALSAEAHGLISPVIQPPSSAAEVQA